MSGSVAGRKRPRGDESPAKHGLLAEDGGSDNGRKKRRRSPISELGDRRPTHAVENALMADAEAETRVNKKALDLQEEAVRSEEALRADSSAGVAMDQVPSYGSGAANSEDSAQPGGDGGPGVPGDRLARSAFTEEQSVSFIEVYCLVSYGDLKFNVPSESELAAEFDNHPNREEMINAVENESESGIHSEERPLVALHNYKSAWMLRALGTEDRELGLFLNACHACACREAGIWDNGSDFSENFINRRRTAYYFQHQGHTMQRSLQLHADGYNGINELTGRACELCHPNGIYNGGAPDTDLRAYDVESYTYTFIREDDPVGGHNRFFLQRRPKRRVRQRRHKNEKKQAADERRKEAMRGF